MNIYDAWNRLVEVRIDENGDGNYDEVRVRYGYNGLHQRATRRANSNDLIIDGDDPGHLYYYDASWRMLEERIDEAWDGANNTFASDEIVQRIWCPLYIDALIAMQTDVNDDVDSGDPDGDFTDADAVIHYAVLDRKYDVIAMMNAAGVIRERVRYMPYGVARHSPGGADLNGDGMVNGSDQATVLATWGAMGTANYSASSDLDRDGDVDGSDLAILFAVWSTTAEPEGVISRIGNTIGYSGYVYDNAVNMSLARFRWYDAETGRWATRDPIADGTSLTFALISTEATHEVSSVSSMTSVYDRIKNIFLHHDGVLLDNEHLYNYVGNNPIRYTDELGLCCNADECFGNCMWEHATNSVGMSLRAAVVATCGPSFPIPKGILPKGIMPNPGIGGPGKSRFTSPLSVIDRLLDEAKRRGYIPPHPKKGGALRKIGRFLAKRACPVTLAAYGSYLAGGAASCGALCLYDPCSW